MNKMTGTEFRTGMDRFLKILEYQPNLVSTRQGCASTGKELAEMAIAFIDRIHELKRERTGSNTD